jgi:hypothetical protein
VGGLLKGRDRTGTVALCSDASKVNLEFTGGHDTPFTFKHTGPGAIMKRIGKQLPVHDLHQVASIVYADRVGIGTVAGIDIPSAVTTV